MAMTIFYVLTITQLCVFFSVEIGCPCMVAYIYLLFSCLSIEQKPNVWTSILCAGKIRLVKSGDSAANISLDELSKFTDYIKILIS